MQFHVLAIVFIYVYLYNIVNKEEEKWNFMY